MKKKYWLLISVISSALLILFDQLTKYWVRRDLSDKDFVLIDKVFKLTYHKNTGAAWGILTGKVDFLVILTVIIIALVIFVMIKLPVDKKYNCLHIIGIFVFSGAIGNMIDRIYFNFVTDFLYIELINFPVFNVADCYITFSMFILAFLIIFKFKDDDFEFLKRKKKVTAGKDDISDSEN